LTLSKMRWTSKIVACRILVPVFMTAAAICFAVQCSV